MNKKIITSFFVVLFLGTALSKGQSAGNCVVDAIMSSYTARSFTDQAVSDSDIDMILKCGIKAPSARNSQMWKFTVVRDNDFCSKVVRNHKPGNVVILISGQDAGQEGMFVDFDCALATQNMFIAAVGLGLGAHIYMAPVRNINETMKDQTGIPEDYRVITVLQIGHIDKSVDATSSASTRKSFDEMVIYK